LGLAVSAREIPISLADLCISSEEIGISLGKIPISLFDLHK